MFTSTAIISMGTYLSTLSQNNDTKTKYSGIYTTIYKSALLFGFGFSSFLLGLLNMSQYYIFYLGLCSMIIVAILLSCSLRKSYSELNIDK